MSHLNEYIESMDYIREKFGLPVTTTMYEAVARVTAEYKLIEEQLQKSLKEKSCPKKTKTSKKTQSKSSK